MTKAEKKQTREMRLKEMGKKGLDEFNKSCRVTNSYRPTNGLQKRTAKMALDRKAKHKTDWRQFS